MARFTVAAGDSRFLATLRNDNALNCLTIVTTVEQIENLSQLSQLSISNSGHGGQIAALRLLDCRLIQKYGCDCSYSFYCCG